MRDLIKQVLENEFNADKFSIFIKNLFNEISINPQDISIAGNFVQHIKGFKFLGEYKDTESKRLDVLIVELAGDTKVSRARSMQRNLIAKYLKDNLCDAALVAFYSQQSPDWRLSFVKMEYRLTDTGARVEVGTPPKRYSFLVGKTEPSHTASSQLLPILEEQKVNPLVSIIEDAFSIEKVIKEFFVQYKQLFTSLELQLEKNHTFKNEAVKNNINAANFAKKLLGQIVFLYFLQKKGWLGVAKGETWGNGDKLFLRHLFNKCLENSENFFNDYLEFLFYDTLNNPRNDQADRNYSARFKCKIPFLNGGLFEPEYDWQNSFIYLDNSIFADIFDVFDLYNFTVKEDEPLEKEVAVDPEMLGKVFENLLEENLRKGKGTYYTPREIVHYMCQESLANYIATDVKVAIEDVRLLIRHMADDLSDLPASITKHAESINKALANIKVVDPACGSGAFCVGMLQEIVKARLLLNPSLLEYRIKKETIQNCIYGVDIDTGAIEIAKLRLWLSLVVDYDLEDIEPLPNLDYKIMQGNSLLEVLVLGERTIKLFDSAAIGIKSAKHLNLSEQDNRLTLFDHDETTKGIFDKYHKWQIKLFNAKTIEKKKEARENLKNIESELIEETLKAEILHLEDRLEKNIGKSLYPELGLDKKSAEKQAKILSLQSRINEILNEIKTAGNRPYFLWHLYFGDVFVEKGGFDVVIANPPYVRQEEINIKTALKSEYEIFNSVSDLYTYFYERGFRLLKNSGTLTFITSSKFLRARYGIVLRKYLKANTTINSIINFGDQHVFDAITNTLIFITVKQKTENNEFNYSDNVAEPDKIKFAQDKLQDSEWTIEKPEIICLKNKIERKGMSLKEWDVKINRGLLTGYNEAFVISSKKKDELIAKDPKAAEIIKPIIRGRDIKRYYFVDSGLYLIVTHNGYRTANNEAVHAINVDEYPSIKDHLDGYIQKLEERQDKGSTVYNQRDCAFMYDFAKQKIVWIELTNKNKFAYSENEDYLLAGAFIMTGKSLKYLLAFMNSRLCLFYFSLICNSSGMATIQWKKFALEKVPIPKIAGEAQTPFNERVDKILDITKGDDYLQNPAKQAKVREYENQIDQLVYKLYDLTPAEITTIEGKNK